MWVFIIFKVTTVQRTAQTVYVVTLSTSHTSIQLPQHLSLSLMPLCNFLFCFFFSVVLLKSTPSLIGWILNSGFNILSKC
jgi:hypothetical protein